MGALKLQFRLGESRQLPETTLVGKHEYEVKTLGSQKFELHTKAQVARAIAAEVSHQLQKLESRLFDGEATRGGELLMTVVYTPEVTS